MALRRTLRLSYAQIAEQADISSSSVARACQHAVARLPPLQEAPPISRPATAPGYQKACTFFLINPAIG